MRLGYLVSLTGAGDRDKLNTKAVGGNDLYTIGYINSSDGSLDGECRMLPADGQVGNEAL